jgi:hypothetical protein
MIKMDTKNNSLKYTAYSFLKYFICFALIAFVAAGCSGLEDPDDDDNAGYDTPFDWPITIAYYYYYTSGILDFERDDNNYDGYIDAVWEFEHDDNDKLESYEYDENNDGVNDWVGEYFYDANDCIERLVQTRVDASEELRWEYTVDGDCNRMTYELFEDGPGDTNPEEEGTYTRDADGNLEKLAVDPLGTWYYTLGITGKPLSYEYYHGTNISIDRVGTYHYDVDNDPDQKLMYLFSRERP